MLHVHAYLFPLFPCCPAFAQFKNKFCYKCRLNGIHVSASRVRLVYANCPFKNTQKPGFWTPTVDLPGSRAFRLINQTGECAGMPMIVASGSFLSNPSCFGPPPEEYITESGHIHLHVSKGTLVPLTSLAPT